MDRFGVAAVPLHLYTLALASAFGLCALAATSAPIAVALCPAITLLVCRWIWQERDLAQANVQLSCRVIMAHDAVARGRSPQRYLRLIPIAGSDG